MTENSTQANVSTQENEAGTTSGLAHEPLYIGRLELNSHPIMGTGDATSADTLERALIASGAELTTVTMRHFTPSTKQNVFETLQRDNIAVLPNTAGCCTAYDTVLTTWLAREALETNLLRLEVIAGENTLLPDPIELVVTVEQLVADDFVVSTYTNDDPALAKQLEDLGYVAVIPAGSPIGTGLDILSPHNIELIVGHTDVPIILDAGIGTTSEAAQAMELGCDAMLLASAVTHTHDLVGMTATVRLNVKAGLTVRESGRIPRRRPAQASSSLEGIITECIGGVHKQDPL